MPSGVSLLGFPIHTENKIKFVRDNTMSIHELRSGEIKSDSIMLLTEHIVVLVF